MRVSWSPLLGANRTGSAVCYRVYAPDAHEVVLHLEGRGDRRMTAEAHGVFAHTEPEAEAGQRYSYTVDGKGPWPDPWSRWQPEGVHGPSAVVDPTAYVWEDGNWTGHPRAHLVIYELHVGTFTPEGTFAAAADRLPWLRDLGVTAVELLPVAAFPGKRNWGYDGAALFAPSEQYGTPDDLRRFVDTAHALGLSVLLDVVYNHLGPDGAYLAAFVPPVLTGRHPSAWGKGIDLDGPDSALVRRTFLDNALHWLVEYHMDGLRLDATHAIIDESDEHWLAMLPREAHALLGAGRPLHFIAEDDRNLSTLLLPRDAGGYGLDGVWADDFHHVVRRRVAGDCEAYYQDYAGTMEELATVLRQGWLYTGQPSAYRQRARGGPAEGVPLPACVVCLQNHDQVGNRAFGERLHHQIDQQTWLAISTVLLMAPETPMIFMGQEWSASSPFLFFTDHQEALGRQVTHGRRAEFKAFSAFDAAATRAAIPDPQARHTWHASVLDWDETGRHAHARTAEAYRRLLVLRRALLFDAPREREQVSVDVPDNDTLLLRQPAADGAPVLVVLSLARGRVAIDLSAHDDVAWRLEFDSRNGQDGAAAFERDTRGVTLVHEAPMAVVLRPGEGARS
jgi:maltooligosyltrehalose trehalohydrolase